MDVRIWNLLHDGGIDVIEGLVPGDLRLQVGLLYLRQMLPGDGEGFIVQLLNCTHFEYTPWDMSGTCDLRAIEAACPEVLSAESGDPVTVCCAGGMLRLRYEAVKVQLDSGEPIDLDVLQDAAERYWAAFEARQRPKPT